jgi:hypothetical protein
MCFDYMVSWGQEGNRDCIRTGNIEFIAVIGNTPPMGLSMPGGRADLIFKKVGKNIL